MGIGFVLKFRASGWDKSGLLIDLYYFSARQIA
jgi:hypothetical protein